LVERDFLFFFPRGVLGIPAASSTPLGDVWDCCDRVHQHGAAVGIEPTGSGLRYSRSARSPRAPGREGRPWPVVLTSAGQQQRPCVQQPFHRPPRLQWIDAEQASRKRPSTDLIADFVGMPFCDRFRGGEDVTAHSRMIQTVGHELSPVSQPSFLTFRLA